MTPAPLQYFTKDHAVSMNQEPSYAKLLDTVREAGGDVETMTAFASLVAAAEREKFCAVLRQLHDSYLLASRSNNIRARGETK